MNDLVGKWQQPEGQAYAGLVFQFEPDGTFRSEYPAMGITSSGTYTVEGDLIFMDQSSHSLGCWASLQGVSWWNRTPYGWDLVIREKKLLRT